MNGIYGLVLIMFMSMANGADVGTASTLPQGSKGLVKPDWAKDLPPDSGADYSIELRRRMVTGSVIRARAVVLTFMPSALSSLNRGGGGGVNVAGTSVRIMSPERFVGVEMVIHHSTPIGPDSLWRVSGTVVEFDFNERYLEGRMTGVPHMGFIYQRDLKNLKFDAAAGSRRGKPGRGTGSRDKK